MPYMNVTEVESAIQALNADFPGLSSLITLPNTTHENRTSRAILIGKGPVDDRPTFLFIGGQHAREWGSCEICINFAADLLEAYDSGSGLAYGGKSFSAAQVVQVMEQTQIILFPCVNPDGRNFSQTSSPMWRPNRNPAAGVDVNRNYDFLWDFRNLFSPSAGLVVSDTPGSELFHGTAANSEPETRNVVWLLDSYPQIQWFIDIHSFSKLLYYNWGDDQNQIADPAMNFRNPAFNNQRGLFGGTYSEFIPPGDQAAERCLAQRMQSAIQAVRGQVYSTGQSFDLYPTSGTATDYPYSRHFSDASQTRVLGFLIEWGTEFQPPWAEMENIIRDISAGLLDFTVAAPCDCSPVEVDLLTPAITFNDVPEGEQTARAVVFNVTTCQAASFQITAGPAVTSGLGSFGTLPSPSANLPASSTTVTRQARLWLSFTGTSDGDAASGTVTVRQDQTGQEWVIPISANTIARPTVATVLVLDQSGSMTFASGLPGLPTRNDVLKFAAPVFVNLLQENNGIGVVAFDHDAYDRMSVQAVSAPGPFDLSRANARDAIRNHTPNPLGNTAIGDGVEKGHNLLAGASGYDHQALLVFTDGHETAAKYISDVAPLITERVFAIGLGTAAQIKPAALTALTNGTGGYLLLTGEMGADDLFRLSKYYLQILAGITNQDIVLDPEGSIKPGQTHRIPFRLNEADIAAQSILLGQTDLPVVRYALETPNGDLIDPGTAGVTPNIDYITEQGISFYQMTFPVVIGPAGASVGQWHAVLTVDDRYYKKYLASLDKYPELYQQVKAHGVRYNLSVQSYSGLRLQARLQQSSFEPGATLTVRAVLTEYGLPIGAGRAVVQAEYQRPDGTGGVLALGEEGQDSGVYTASLPAALEGVYSFRVLASGKTLRGRAFTREQLLTGAVWRGGDQPPPGGSSDPGQGKDDLCDLLECLLSDKVITPRLQERLKELGLDLGGLRECLKEWCRGQAAPGPVLTRLTPEMADLIRQIAKDL